MRMDSPLSRPGPQRLCWLLPLLVWSTGCQRGMYDATSLPQDLHAPYTIDTQALDLSNLASSVSNSQKIYAGDTLSMTVVTGAEQDKPETWPLRVNENGAVDIPLVGPIQLAGLDLQSAQAVVRRASIQRGIYRSPSVSISVNERQTNRVTVLGAVDKPGSYDLPVANSDLLSAISTAGSLTEEADRVIEIRQPPLPAPPTSAGEYAMAARPAVGSAPVPLTPDVVHIDLVAATSRPNTGGFHLRDGAVVLVRKRPKRIIHVMGLVERPNQFELPPNKNFRVLDALSMAGGRRLSMADRVLVVRQVPGKEEPAVIEVSVRKAKQDKDANILLADGDVVSLEETPVTIVLGALQQFIRIGVNGSMAVF